MGFNIEQYEMYDNDSYSNGSGKLKAKLGIGSGKLKSKLGIGDGKIFGKVVSKNKNTQFEANKYVTSGQQAIDAKKAIDEEKESNEQAKSDEILATSSLSSTPDTEKSKTGMYVGIGAGVLVIGVIAFFLIKKNK